MPDHVAGNDNSTVLDEGADHAPSGPSTTATLLERPGGMLMSCSVGW